MKYLILLLAFFAFRSTYGQDKCSHLPLITVQATASVEALPDVAIVVVKVEKRVLVNGIKGGSDSFFFMKEDMDIKYVDDKNTIQSLPEVKMGGDACLFVKSYIITLRNLANLQQLYTNLIARNFTQIESVRFRVTNIESLKEKATIEALQRAKAKAQLYANQIGQPLGVVHQITELNSEPVNWYDERNKTDDNAMLGGNYLINPPLAWICNPCCKNWFNIARFAEPR
ncbi:MAG: SIMPL domain-containing protein [Breznakibacter sp.]|nr:SIMPL domain-containing protein [Breznakibacter sp.]